MMANVKDRNGNLYVNEDGTGNYKTEEDKNFYQKLKLVDKDLIALHNTSEDAVRKSLKLGGLPVPSIAITKKNTEYSGFGEITFIMNKDVVDPSKTPIYSRDAWTGTFPELIRKGQERALKNSLEKK